jgi:hypothetical protein
MSAMNAYTFLHHLWYGFWRSRPPALLLENGRIKSGSIRISPGVWYVPRLNPDLEHTAMAGRKYPLEIVLRAHGPAELINSDEELLWTSESDDDFKEEFGDEFLEEEDADEIVEFLFDSGILAVNEYNAFKSDRWDVTLETLKSSAGPGDDGDDDGDDDFDIDDEDIEE